MTSRPGKGFYEFYPMARIRHLLFTDLSVWSPLSHQLDDHLITSIVVRQGFLSHGHKLLLLCKGRRPSARGDASYSYYVSSRSSMTPAEERCDDCDVVIEPFLHPHRVQVHSLEYTLVTLWGRFDLVLSLSNSTFWRFHWAPR